jgi:hypothetical protein
LRKGGFSEVELAVGSVKSLLRRVGAWCDVEWCEWQKRRQQRLASEEVFWLQNRDGVDCLRTFLVLLSKILCGEDDLGVWINSRVPLDDASFERNVNFQQKMEEGILAYTGSKA